ncbi:MAG: proton-conducting transporter membrane subunit [Kiritimatiellae bacterium]|nr:proton-conducting transporter membrane subunit [Kiritimatiellia bacterium]
MNLVLAAFGFLLLGAFLSLFLAKHIKILRIAGPVSVVLGCCAGIIPAIISIIRGISESLCISWQIPFGSFSIEMDPLSALFSIAILFISSLSAIFGSGYLRHYEDTKNIGIHWFFFNLLVASMLMVVLARNAVLFLLAWEIMSLSSFFLVVFEHEKAAVRRAGWTYFIATHIGTAFLFVMFLLLGRKGGSLDFASFHLVDGTGTVACVVFLFAIIGFGTKAGFMPFHIWLPEAHPAAPSHVSAVMSGVMIKTGIYGLVRILTFLEMPPPWWGWILVIIGVVSGICGVLFALAQHDFKRSLAYHSVENIGIIALGLGIGLLGVSYDNPGMAFLGFAGGLLHVVNHAVFKSLLFLSAGAVLYSTGSREIDHLGGLMKKMPYTATAFLVGSVAICGLPPLNGFISEFMIYVGSFEGVLQDYMTEGPAVGGIITVASLALIGGLAIACFTKAFGIIFLGESRSQHCDHAHEVNMAMKIPMLVLMTACVLMGLWGSIIFDVMPGVTGLLTKTVIGGTGDDFFHSYKSILLNVTFFALALIVVIVLFVYLRSRLMSRKHQANAVTWDCGYLAPTAKMQYTASSFAQPITRLFQTFLRTTRRISAPDGLFPKSASFSSETNDFYREQVYKPTFNAMGSWLSKFRQIQHGRLNLYIMYVVLALVVLFVWKLR